MPWVAAALLFTRKKKMGALVARPFDVWAFHLRLLVSLSLAYGDNVTQVHGPWHSTFLWTAIVLGVIELAGAWMGFSLFRASVA
jgi:hypothetical protein